MLGSSFSKVVAEDDWVAVMKHSPKCVFGAVFVTILSCVIKLVCPNIFLRSL